MMTALSGPGAILTADPRVAAQREAAGCQYCGRRLGLGPRAAVVDDSWSGASGDGPDLLQYCRSTIRSRAARPRN